jgi:hypothetical protein
LPEAFLQLQTDNRKAILEKAAQESGKGANVLEMDVWVCWTLEKLVSLPDAPPLAFKGGTSLSKIYDAISRFSEDVDVTIDRNVLDPNLDPFEEGKSRTRRRKDCDALDELLTEYLNEVVKPHFDEHLRSELNDQSIETQLGEVHGQLIIPYPSCFDRADAYMPESILLELGGKNAITPAEKHDVSSYLEAIVPSVDYPSAAVPVLSAERTFWEKATLIHSECNRGRVKDGGVARMSRHWYDLAQLASGEVGPAAIEDKDLLADVVLQKNVLYYAGYSNYEACLIGGLALVPQGELAAALEEDFERMKGDGMFWQATGNFDDVVGLLAKTETEINTKYSD